MKAKRQYLLSGALLALLTAWFTLAGPMTIANAQGQPGTSLEAAVTSAVGFSNTTIEFDWVTAIEAVPTELTLNTTESGTINYTLSTTRTEASRTNTSGVTGAVQVTNTGVRPTENLSISIEVQAQTGAGGFTPIQTTTVSTRDNPVLDPGETGSYTWTTTFDPVAGATAYRVVAYVTIDNHSGHLGTAYGPTPRSTFSLPSTPSIIRVDDTATVSFTQTDLSGSGFRVSAAPGDLVLRDSGTSTFSTTITNNTDASGTYTFTTTATLTESTTRESTQRESRVNIIVP